MNLFFFTYKKGLCKPFFITHLILSLLLAINFSYSQNSGKIQYKMIPTGGTFENKDEIKKTNVSGYFKGIDEAIRTLTAELVFQKNTSYYSLLPSMNVDDRINKAARAFVGNGEYFTTKNGEYIHKKTLLGEEFCVLTLTDTDWKLTAESKTINGYLCYKATRIRTSEIKGKTKSFEIIAWYCPKIPLSFGPSGNGNLPGLILELQEPLKTYLAVKIDLTQHNILVKKAPCVPISEKEFNTRYNKILNSQSN